MCVDAVVRRMVATGNDSYPFCGPIVRNCILAGLHGDHLHGDHLHSDHLHGLMASRRCVLCMMSPRNALGQPKPAGCTALPLTTAHPYSHDSGMMYVNGF